MSLPFRFASTATLLLLLIPHPRYLQAAAPPSGLQTTPVMDGDRPPLVVWTDARDPDRTALYWDALPESGPAGSGHPVTGRHTVELHPALACAPGWGLLAWESATPEGGHQARAGKVWPGPVPALAADRVLNAAGYAQRPAVAVRGDHGVVVWQDDRTGTAALYYTRWERDGGPLDPGGAPVSDGTRYAAPARVASTAWGFLIAWTERDPADGSVGLVLRRLDPEGGFLGGPVERVIAAPTTVFLETATRGDGAIVLWREPGVGGSDLRWCQVDRFGVGAPRAFPAGPGFEYLPRAVSGELGTAVVWMSVEAGRRALRLAWIDDHGIAHPPAGILLEGRNRHPADPAICRFGSNVRVAWRRPNPQDDDDLWSVSLPWGSVKPPEPEWLVVAGSPVAIPGRDLPATRGLRVAPNPARGPVRVSLPGVRRGDRLHVLDVRGRRWAWLVADRDGWTWDGTGPRGRAPAGLYLLKPERDSAAVRMVRLP